ncbi:MAG: hypothetical protein R2761_22035 [Acidimicrobiales bacterium]
MDDAAGEAHDEAARVEGLLRGLGVDPADLLGFGGEARVWALGADRVVRLCHPGTPRDAVHQRIELLDALSSGPTPPPWALGRAMPLGRPMPPAASLRPAQPGRIGASSTSTPSPGT